MHDVAALQFTGALICFAFGAHVGARRGCLSCLAHGVSSNNLRSVDRQLPCQLIESHEDIPREPRANDSTPHRPILLGVRHQAVVITTVRTSIGSIHIHVRRPFRVALRVPRVSSRRQEDRGCGGEAAEVARRICIRAHIRVDDCCLLAVGSSDVSVRRTPWHADNSI